MRGKQRSPPGFRPAGTKVGDGSSPSSLSRADIWRPKGCRLPDAILHGKRNCGLIAGPSSALRSRGFRVRPLSSLGLAFAAPACEPDKDTFVTCGSASLPFNAGSATAFGSALARCYGSDLLALRLHLAHKPAVFLTSPAFWKGEAFAEARFLPGAHAHFVSPFGVFHLADWLTRQSHAFRVGTQ